MTISLTDSLDQAGWAYLYSGVQTGSKCSLDRPVVHHKPRMGALSYQDSINGSADNELIVELLWEGYLKILEGCTPLQERISWDEDSPDSLSECNHH